MVLLAEVLHPVLLLKRILPKFLRIDAAGAPVAQATEALFRLGALPGGLQHPELGRLLRACVYCLVVLDWIPLPLLIVVVLFLWLDLWVLRSRWLTWVRSILTGHRLRKVRLRSLGRLDVRRWLRLHGRFRRLILNFFSVDRTVVFLVFVVILHHLVEHALLLETHALIAADGQVIAQFAHVQRLVQARIRWCASLGVSTG